MKFAHCHLYLCAALGLAIGTHTAIAHHSVAGQFDRERPATLTGVISDIDWINPHIYIHLDVENDAGGVDTWRLESVPPSYLRKARLTRDMLMNSGSQVTIHVILPHDETPHLGFVQFIRYPDGREYQMSAE